MTPGKLERRYYAVPEGATYAEVKLVSSNFQTKRMMVVAANSIPAPKSSTKFTIFDEYVWMENNDEKVKRFDVFAGRTLELVVGQFWSALGSTGELKFSIEFRGIAADTNVLSFTSFDESLRVNVRSFVTLESLNPKAQLGIVQRALYPTSSQVTLLNAAVRHFMLFIMAILLFT
jgi:tripeptidyl-peptidase-2